jgi:hypothetical protein
MTRTNTVTTFHINSSNYKPQKWNPPAPGVTERVTRSKDDPLKVATILYWRTGNRDAYVKIKKADDALKEKGTTSSLGNGIGCR